MNYFNDIVIPESPRVLSKEQVSLQVPVASTTVPGLASFNDDQFVVIDGRVRLKDEYLDGFADGPIGGLSLNIVSRPEGEFVQLLNNGVLLNEVSLGIFSSEERTVTPTKSVQNVTPATADYLSKVIVNPIPDEYVIPSGEEGKAINIYTESEMSALLTTAGPGTICKYLGPAGMYETDTLYIIEEED